MHQICYVSHMSLTNNLYWHVDDSMRKLWRNARKTMTATYWSATLRRNSAPRQSQEISGARVNLSGLSTLRQVLVAGELLTKSSKRLVGRKVPAASLPDEKPVPVRPSGSIARCGGLGVCLM